MFVTKAAVVGAGTMGGEIAQVISSAGIPVVLKDIDQKFVDQGLNKAEEVSKIQTGSQVKKEKITREQADEQVAAILERIAGTTSYDELGDVD
jgi:3-hydroxyacyl-CoA dehydrogenase